MSTQHRRGAPTARLAGSGPRALALASGLALTATYVGILYEVTGVVTGGTTGLPTVGDAPTTLLVLVAAAVTLSTLFALAVRPRVALGIGVAVLAAGAAAYLQAAPLGWLLLTNVDVLVVDTVALASGLSILRVRAAEAWALGFAPGPVFLSWYLFVRGRYALGVSVGGAALLWFVLTGDAGTTTTLVGVVASATALGAGELERRGRSLVDVEVLAVVLAAMVLVTTTVSLVPVAGGGSFLPDGQTPTVEGGVVGAGDRLSVIGSVSLSPKVRFVVESNEAAYWRVGAYDRYTGEGWVRSGSSVPYEEGTLGRPRGEQIAQRVSVRTTMTVLPAAWQPASLSGDATSVASISSMGGLLADGTLEPGDEYTVVSRRPSPAVDALRSFGTDYGSSVDSRYTQLPADTPERLATFTDRLTADADGAYEVANRIETWLEQNKGYSLDVDRPDGNIASSFVFDMEEGYCTYFATAMVSMLRTQDIPARFVVGYTPGQRVDSDRWVVRGYNAHAWVEVYFPIYGWIKFDPTPGGPRVGAEQERLEEARENDVEGVDTDGSEDGRWTPTPSSSPTETPTTGPGTGNSTPSTTGPGYGTPIGKTPAGAFEADLTPAEGEEGPGGPTLPSEGVLALGLVVLAGLAASVRRSGAFPKLTRLLATYRQRRRDDPEADVRRAAERLEYVLGRVYRERRPGESRPRYLAVVAGVERDDRLRRVGRTYEQAVYGGGVDRGAADEVVALVDEVVRERLPPLFRD